MLILQNLDYLLLLLTFHAIITFHDGTSVCGGSKNIYEQQDHDKLGNITMKTVFDSRQATHLRLLPYIFEPD